MKTTVNWLSLFDFFVYVCFFTGIFPFKENHCRYEYEILNCVELSKYLQIVIELTADKRVYFKNHVTSPLFL
jgi:hypothetical protein